MIFWHVHISKHFRCSFSNKNNFQPFHIFAIMERFVIGEDVRPPNTSSYADLQDEVRSVYLSIVHAVAHTVAAAYRSAQSHYGLDS